MSVETHCIGSLVLFVTPARTVLAHASWNRAELSTNRKEAEACRAEAAGLALLGWKGRGGR